MKVLAVSGSARARGNTAVLVGHALDELERVGIETEFIELAGKKVLGCTGCRLCAERKDGQCHGRRDDLNDILPKIFEADGIIIASPVYFADVTAETKALIERVGMVAGANGGLLKRKVGAAVIAVRRGGAIHAFDTINHLFFITQMIVAGSSYWNLGVGREPGEVEGDEEGMRTMRVLGENMAWLLEKTRG